MLGDVISVGEVRLVNVRYGCNEIHTKTPMKEYLSKDVHSSSLSTLPTPTFYVERSSRTFITTQPGKSTRLTCLSVAEEGNRVQCRSYHYRL